MTWTRVFENPLTAPRYIEGPGDIQARFDDGFVVNIHRGESGRYYALHPYDPRDPYHRLDAKQRNKYQRAALEHFLSGASARISKDSQGDLVADLKG
jgi:hypothetical protein